MPQLLPFFYFQESFVTLIALIILTIIYAIYILPTYITLQSVRRFLNSL